MQRKTPRIASEAYQKRICSECWHGDIGICGALLKQLYGIHQGVVGHMDITIHGFLECRCVKPLDQNRIPPDNVLPGSEFLRIVTCHTYSMAALLLPCIAPISLRR